MEQKINIAELLKDCPSGMELYSPIFGKVYLDKIRPHLAIIVTTDKYKEEFLYDGRYGMNGECMLFPSKDQRDWSKFQQPFKDGDVVATTDGFWIGITTGGKKGKFIPTYCVIQYGGNFEAYLDRKESWVFNRLATEEEKQKLFDAIKDNGYKWNPETKTLEKLPEPKFKIGDRIIRRDSIVNSWIVSSVSSEYYGLKSPNSSECIGILLVSEQDDWELVPNKFDVTTLKPFDKVLVRCGNNGYWSPQFFAKYRNASKFPFECTYNAWEQCIPYKGNEHLLDTTNNCDNYYKTWE